MRRAVPGRNDGGNETPQPPHGASPRLGPSWAKSSFFRILSITAETTVRTGPRSDGPRFVLWESRWRCGRVVVADGYAASNRLAAARAPTLQEPDAKVLLELPLAPLRPIDQRNFRHKRGGNRKAAKGDCGRELGAQHLVWAGWPCWARVPRGAPRPLARTPEPLSGNNPPVSPLSAPAVPALSARPPPHLMVSCGYVEWPRDDLRREREAGRIESSAEPANCGCGRGGLVGRSSAATARSRERTILGNGLSCCADDSNRACAWPHPFEQQVLETDLKRRQSYSCAWVLANLSSIVPSKASTSPARPPPPLLPEPSLSPESRTTPLAGPVDSDEREAAVAVTGLLPRPQAPGMHDPGGVSSPAASSAALDAEAFELARIEPLAASPASSLARLVSWSLTSFSSNVT
eukprot:scaffold26749_cov27-Tisochrysis_lutea.AAC.1